MKSVHHIDPTLSLSNLHEMMPVNHRRLRPVERRPLKSRRRSGKATTGTSSDFCFWYNCEVRDFGFGGPAVMPIEQADAEHMLQFCNRSRDIRLGRIETQGISARRLAFVIADFCNKIGTSPTNPMSAAMAALPQHRHSGLGGRSMKSNG
jgi:hypothetical protein